MTRVLSNSTGPHKKTFLCASATVCPKKITWNAHDLTRNDTVMRLADVAFICFAGISRKLSVSAPFDHHTPCCIRSSLLRIADPSPIVRRDSICHEGLGQERISITAVQQRSGSQQKLGKEETGILKFSNNKVVGGTFYNGKHSVRGSS